MVYFHKKNVHKKIAMIKVVLNSLQTKQIGRKVGFTDSLIVICKGANYVFKGSKKLWFEEIFFPIPEKFLGNQKLTT